MQQSLSLINAPRPEYSSFNCSVRSGGVFSESSDESELPMLITDRSDDMSMAFGCIVPTYTTDESFPDKQKQKKPKTTRMNEKNFK